MLPPLEDPRTPSPKKSLPRWVEPLFILGFCITAILEWNAGDTGWAIFFALAAFLFSATAFAAKMNKNKK